MENFRLVVRPLVLAMLLLLISPAISPQAFGQATFTLTPAPLVPSSIDPGGSASSNIMLTPLTGFAGTVNLSCAVTSSVVTPDMPQCTISPSTESGSSVPSVTITTTGSTPAGTYQVTITGTDGASVVTTTLSLNVADLAVDYSITVFPTTAIPSPVVAGSVATTTVTVAAIGNYSGSVTLSCLTVSPAVAGAPVCSFNPATVKVTTSVAPTSTLTLTSYGELTTPTTPTTKMNRPRLVWAGWLGLPAFVFFGLGAAGKRRSKFLGIFLLLTIGLGLLLEPGCGSNTPVQINPNINQVTPANTYTFTLTGSDANGVGPSSTTSATVSLQVTAQ